MPENHIDARRRFERRHDSAHRPTLVSADSETAGGPWTRNRPVKLSILMPAYNEERTLARAVDAVLSATYPCEVELIVVDDGSADSTPEILAAVDDPRARVFRHPLNRGKGAALQTAARVATGTHIVPFDADLEYSPADLPRLVEPVLRGRCDVVYGTRLFGVNTVYQSYRLAMGNRAMTLAANVLFDAYLSDLHTCLKLMPLDLFRMLELNETGFGLDTEITARILKNGIRPFEVPVSYHSRSYEDGKKITWRHGVECLEVLARVRLSRRRDPVLSELPRAQQHADEVYDAIEVLEKGYRRQVADVVEARAGGRA
jgi:glycosyltransferase involved in cell wall biosynthesis